ncbi:glycosyltransferase 87 family protein [Blastococcus sp. TF02A_35]|uniref:glycosyltransferase 87 family protein n=1 Tax=Blastococcus sp. TF02A-35 TaxID=2559612 RepID=UPI001ADDB2B0|nr:glycosyltransferase 87 family protein [Blastococcus sp. TF02A_35]
MQVAAALACLFGLAVVVQSTGAETIDLAVYRAGGQLALDGGALYDGPVFRGDMLFTYTPFAALLFTPLAMLTPAAATVAVALLNAALLVWCALRCWQATPLRVGRGQRLLLAGGTAGVLLATEAVHATLFLGQVNLLLMALVLWDLLGRESRRTVGIGIGIAAGIKLTPFLLVGYLLVTRRLRAAVTSVVAFAGTVLVGLVLLPGPSVTFWLGGTFADPTRVYADVTSTHNQSLRGLLLRSGLSQPVAQLLWMAAAAAVVAVTFLLAARAYRAGERVLAVALCGMCGATVSPWTWGHHWVWLVPLAVFLGGVLLRPRWARRDLVWLAPTALLPLTFPWVLALADPPDASGAPPVLDAGPAALVVGNLYVLVFLTTLAATAWHLRARAEVVPVAPGRAEGPVPVAV